MLAKLEKLDKGGAGREGEGGGARGVDGVHCWAGLVGFDSACSRSKVPSPSSSSLRIKPCFNQILSDFGLVVIWG